MATAPVHQTPLTTECPIVPSTTITILMKDLQEVILVEDRDNKDTTDDVDAGKVVDHVPPSDYANLSSGKTVRVFWKLSGARDIFLHA
jgi:hypothetical protein